jgi:hypothetical protein
MDDVWDIGKKLLVRLAGSVLHKDILAPPAAAAEWWPRKLASVALADAAPSVGSWGYWVKACIAELDIDITYADGAHLEHLPADVALAVAGNPVAAQAAADRNWKRYTLAKTRAATTSRLMAQVITESISADASPSSALYTSLRTLNCMHLEGYLHGRNVTHVRLITLLRMGRAPLGAVLKRHLFIRESLPLAERHGKHAVHRARRTGRRAGASSSPSGRELVRSLPPVVRDDGTCTLCLLAPGAQAAPAAYVPPDPTDVPVETATHFLTECPSLAHARVGFGLAVKAYDLAWRAPLPIRQWALDIAIEFIGELQSPDTAVLWLLGECRRHRCKLKLTPPKHPPASQEQWAAALHPPDGAHVSREPKLASLIKTARGYWLQSLRDLLAEYTYHLWSARRSALKSRLQCHHCPLVVRPVRRRAEPPVHMRRTTNSVARFHRHTGLVPLALLGAWHRRIHPPSSSSDSGGDDDPRLSFGDSDESDEI